MTGAVTGIFAIFAVVCFVAKDFVYWIAGIWCMAFEAGFVAAAGVVDAFEGIVVRFSVVRFDLARRATIRLYRCCGRRSWIGWIYRCAASPGLTVIVFGPGEFGAAAVIVAELKAGQIANEVVQSAGTFFTAEFLQGIKVVHEFGDGKAGKVFKEVAGFRFFECGAGF